MKHFISIFLILALLFLPENVFAANTHSTDLENTSSQDWSILDAAQTGLDLTGDFTIEMWVQIETAPTAGQIFELIDKHAGAGDQRSYYISYQNTAGTLQFEVGINSAGTAGQQSTGTLNQDLSTATFKHLAFVYTASAGSIEVFVNAASVGSIGSLKTSIFNGTAPFTIGGGAPGSGSPGFDGLIDEVRVWNDVRTSTEISDNKCVEVAIDAAGLVAYWRFNDDAGVDQTANNNDLTNNNTATFSTTYPSCFDAVAVAAPSLNGDFIPFQ